MMLPRPESENAGGREPPVVPQVPTVLRGLKGWLVWRLVKDPNNPGAKPRKIPFYANGRQRSGVQGGLPDRASLTTYDGALLALREGSFDGLGFAPMLEWGITALDFDACVDGSGVIDPAVEAVVAGTYAEISPSGKGVRAFVMGGNGWGNGKSCASGGVFGVECFSSKGFVTVTGQLTDMCSMTGCEDTVSGPSAGLIALYAARFGSRGVGAGGLSGLAESPPLGIPVERIRQCLAALDPGMGYGDWLKVGMALHHETNGEDAGLALWDAWSALGAAYPGSDELAYKWDTFGRGSGSIVGAGWLIKEANAAGANVPVGAGPAAIDEFADLGEDRGGGEGKKEEKDRWSLPDGISQLEWDTARHAPDCIVDGLIYADLRLLIAPGGTGKTTLMLHEAICIVLGLPLWGREVLRPGPVVIVTAEDSREMLTARLRSMARAMGLDASQVALLRSGVRIADVSGGGFKLTQVAGDVVLPSGWVDVLIEEIQSLQPVLVVIDPAVSFGVGESRVNDAEQGLVEAARRLRNGLKCAVQYIHHSGKANARAGAIDQYAGRGGSAFADGARMVCVLTPVSADDWALETGATLGDGQYGIRLALPKLSYCPPVRGILIRRSGYLFEHVATVERSPASERDANAEKVFGLLVSELAGGRQHSKTSLESVCDMQRGGMKKAVDWLIACGRVEICRTGKGQGIYLNPVHAAESANFDEGDSLEM